MLYTVSCELGLIETTGPTGGTKHTQVPTQKLISLRPSNFVCACCPGVGGGTKAKVKANINNFQVLNADSAKYVRGCSPMALRVVKEELKNRDPIIFFEKTIHSHSGVASQVKVYSSRRQESHMQRRRVTGAGAGVTGLGKCGVSPITSLGDQVAFGSKRRARSQSQVRAFSKHVQLCESSSISEKP